MRAEAEFDKARRNFWAFRLAIHPELIKGWWPKEIAGHLQAFYKSLVAGERPKLAIAAPPQHGKSMAITDFIDPSPPVVLEVKIAERLTVLVADDEAGVVHLPAGSGVQVIHAASSDPR